MILAIETSAEPASLALTTPNGEVITRTFRNENQVNVPLADELAQLLEHADGTITTILVGAGPGSYSGARVGLATAEALGISYQSPVITLPSVFGINTTGAYALAGDARRGAYFLITPASPEPQIFDPQNFASAVAELPADTQLISFEPSDKLPLTEQDKEKIQIIPSTAADLITHWGELSPEEQSLLNTQANEIIYLRPPNITKAKSPF